MEFKEINDKIKGVEMSLKAGDLDMTEATSYVEEFLKDYTASDDAIVHFKEYKAPEGLGRNHIPSNIPDLDNLIGGFGKGDIILISGDTGDGKSTFARFLVRKLSEQGKKSLVFSYEETNEEFLSKFRGDLPDGYVPKVLTAKDPTWIEAKVLEAVELYGIEAIFIDNLKGIINYDSKRNEVGEVDAIIQRLKAIAIKYNIVLFLLAHIKKSDTGLIDKNSLTGSKTIVDTASVGIALYRNPIKQSTESEEENGKLYTNFTTAYLIKNRYKGKYDNFLMEFDETTGLYKQGDKIKFFAEKNKLQNDTPNTQTTKRRKF
jgi:replicative DNA helicase